MIVETDRQCLYRDCAANDMYKKATGFNRWLPAFASDIFMEQPG